MHIPVLKDEVLEALQIKEGGIYVDLTLGGGGHSRLILDALKTGTFLGFDQDVDAIKRAQFLKDDTDVKVHLIHANFADFKTHLDALNIDKVDGVLMDLGVSSFQLDEAERGFSYRFDGPLDMRMDANQTLSAYTIVNTYDEKTLKEILYQYGEERFAPQIVRAILKQRSIQPIKTTLELVDVIKSALPMKKLSMKGHPAKQTFQAIRMAVNEEINVLKNTLDTLIPFLNVRGRLVVISFHSLEDRLVKNAMKAASTIDHPAGLVSMPDHEADFLVITKKPVLPTDQETELNPRSKSAKMRVLERIKAEF
jgi:16S rRNA (cytosine1402-N4)-methyltransferase